MAVMTQALTKISGLGWGMLAMGAGASAASIYGSISGHGMGNRTKRFAEGSVAGAAVGLGAYGGMRALAGRGGWAARASSAIGDSAINRAVGSGVGALGEALGRRGQGAIGRAVSWMSRL